MFQPWRIKLREAEQAVKAGRLDEACRLLSQGDLKEFLPAKKLLARLAQEYATRGQALAHDGQSMAGWRDLEKAEALGADVKRLGKARDELTSRVLAEAERYIAAREPLAAAERLEELHRHHALNADVRALRQVATKVLDADRLARSGRFAEAEKQLAGAVALRPDLKSLAAIHEEYCEREAESRRLNERLHQCLASEDWTSVASVADQILAIAPQCDLARDARRRAWDKVGARVSPIEPHRPRLAVRSPRGDAVNGHAHAKSEGSPRNSTMSNPADAGGRFLVWVDTVGGFLVCEGNEITIGQPVPDSDAEIQILGDLSRRHAVIRRDSEGYLIEPIRPTRYNGRPIDKVTVLADGGIIELGEGVKLRFRRPHALSATARLEFVSRHHSQPAVDGIVLLAESCVLGPGGNCHIPCRNWSKDVVLYRQGNELYVCAAKGFDVDGVAHTGRGRISRSSSVSGEGFSLSLEPVV